MDHHDLDFDPSPAQLLRLELEALGLVEEQQALGGAGADELGRRPDDRTEDTDPDAVDVEDLRGAVQPVGRLAGRLVDDVGGEEREVGAVLMGLESLDAEVELVIAKARGVEPPGVLHVDRRHVVEQGRVRRGRADVVAGRQQQGLPRQRRCLLVEHRRQLARAADGDGAQVDRRRGLIELAVEVIEPDDRQRPEPVAAPEQVEPHDALAVLRRRDVEEERRRRGEVDAAHVLGHSSVDRVAAGEERRPHVGVAGEVLDVGHVAVLAEERREGDERARRGRVELVRRRREDDEIAGPGRVGHVSRAVRAVGDGARLGLGEGAVDDFPTLRPSVVGPVVGVGQSEECGLDLGDRRRLVRRGHLLETAAGRIAAGEVEVDLDGAARPARLGLADRLTGGGAAVRRLRPRQQPEVDQDLARVDGEELRREPVVG